MSIYKTKRIITEMMAENRELYWPPDFETLTGWFQNLNPYLTLKEVYEISRKFANDIYGDPSISVLYFKNIPAEEYYTDRPLDALYKPDYIDYISTKDVIKRHEIEDKADYTELYHLYDLLNNNPTKLKEFLKSKALTDIPYKFVFQYLMEHKKHNRSQTNVKPTKSNKKQKKQEDSESEYELEKVKKITDSVLKDKLLKIKNETKEIKVFLKN